MNHRSEFWFHNYILFGFLLIFQSISWPIFLFGCWCYTSKHLSINFDLSLIDLIEFRLEKSLGLMDMESNKTLHELKWRIGVIIVLLYCFAYRIVFLMLHLPKLRLYLLWESKYCLGVCYCFILLSKRNDISKAEFIFTISQSLIIWWSIQRSFKTKFVVFISSSWFRIIIIKIF